ncbi:MAG: orotate phosphoribosyltransferase [Deltaproteobacteria bacterium]|jgi:orotate phosphoribosyltransferase|nr:orotate phosphoribosyltransferase [Deltaproteobacteria bacterium]
MALPTDLIAARAELLADLTARAFERREVTLASGKKSDFYIDCKQVTLDGRGHVLIGRLFYEAVTLYEKRVGVKLDGVGGLTMGADPLASAVTMTASLLGRHLPAFLVRKEPKGHGTQAYLEGVKNLPAGGRLAVLEDVVTTGGSAAKAIDRAREAGFVVPLVLGLVDRREGGREALEAMGVELITLFDRRDFLPDALA